MRNLLETRSGRLFVFFFLYLTEGIPLGFAATAAATVLRRQGVGPAEIGVFVGALYLPWAFKWIAGPFVDTLYWRRMGRRRSWILIAQSFMVGTLLLTIGASLPGELKLFTLFIIIHNSFGAIQDVAIDALAVGVLKEDERGLANGVMFGAAYLGQAVGGSVVLYLLGAGISFKIATVLVAAAIAMVTIFIVLPLREKQEPVDFTEAPGQGFRHALNEIKLFLIETWKGFTSHRGAWVGVLFALLPAGAMTLGLSLQSNLAVELGMTDNSIANLNLWSTILSAGFCVLGGLVSDKIGRRRALMVYIPLISLPVFYMAWRLKEYGWIMPVDTTDPNRAIAAPALISAFWIATLSYSVFNGLMYGTRTAIYMDVTNPAVAATQFTAYMALMNLTISYSANWQGWWIERFGYPSTLTVDGVFGLVCLALIPFMTPRPKDA